METLRQFKLAHVLRVAASDIAGTLPIMNSGLLRSMISNCSSGLATIPPLTRAIPC